MHKFMYKKIILNTSNLIFKLEPWQVEVESTGRKVKRLKSEDTYFVFEIKKVEMIDGMKKMFIEMKWTNQMLPNSF